MKDKKRIRSLEPIRKQRTIQQNEMLMRRKIFNVFYQTILADLINIIKQDKTIHIKNSQNVLFDAIKKNQIYYKNNKFYGSFNSKIIIELKKLGAVYDVSDQSYFLLHVKLPFNLKQTLQHQVQRNTLVINQIGNKLDQLGSNMQNVAFLAPIFLKIISNLDKQITHNVLKVKKTDLAEINLRHKQAIAERYTQNMELYIKDFTTEAITKLRNNIQQKISSGVLYKDLVQDIQHTYNLAKNKAEFLSGQEIRLLTAVYQSERYKMNGIKKFKWRHRDTSNPTARPHHVEWDKESRNGKLFDFDNPPKNPITGEPEIPGSAFHCHCFAEVIAETED